MSSNTEFGSGQTPEEIWAQWNREVNNSMPTTTNNKPVTTTNTGYKTHWASCKHPPKWAFADPYKIQFFGATGSEVYDAYTFNYVFDLNRSFRDAAGAIPNTKRTPPPPAIRPSFIVNGPDEFKATDELQIWTPPKPVEPLNPPTVYIDIAWPDMGVISTYGLAAWKHIYDQLTVESEVLVSCTGGHGRTGTFLAIMYGIAWQVGGRQAINDIRAEYCKEALETKGQEDYVVNILKEYE